jgi:hypothetical protein
MIVGWSIDEWGVSIPRVSDNCSESVYTQHLCCLGHLISRYLVRTRPSGLRMGKGEGPKSIRRERPETANSIVGNLG